jgi:ABC-type glycerol-3-phosphate transport system substrate-binding protein
MQAARGIVVGILVLVGIYLLAAGGRNEPAAARGRVVVQYWEKWTGKEAEQMMQIVDDFNRTVGREKNIYVRYLSMSNVNQKTLVATAAGAPPDIAGLWDTQVAQFAAIDAVEPLDDLAREYGITAGYYKPVYWEGCRYNNKLWALVSTPAAVALHYNKRIFAERADRLRAAGLDPARGPRTLEELDRYAAALDTFTTDASGKRQIQSAGYLPMEPGWYLAYTGYWFGANLYDEETGRLTLTSPEMIRAFQWIKRYSVKMGKNSMTEFRSGFGQFNSTQNPFLQGTVVMEQQGPWMANYIENLKPSMNRWRFPKEREKNLPLEARRANYEWGVAPFPSATGQPDVTLASFDTLMIPKGAKHKREAFEFLAYVNRQDVMEKLNALHCKNSPLARVSARFRDEHPNPYIAVFERLAASPNARGVPDIPIWPEVNDELGVVAQRVYLLEAEPEQALAAAQKRLQEKLDAFLARQRIRRGNEGGRSAAAAVSGARS